MFRLINAEGSYITKLDDWPKPKKMSQWKDGRSAKEFARFFTETHSCGPVPSVYLELLERDFPGIEFQGGQPECSTSLPPKGSSGPRMHDLHLWGTWNSGSVTVCVEAKADEPFKETICQYKTKAKKELKSNPQSDMKDRLGSLLECVWRVKQPSDSLTDLRYQLLHALVGTGIQAISDAEKSGKVARGTGVLLNHVFETNKTKRGKLEKNKRDLERFTRALPNVTIPAAGIVPGELYGPAIVYVPGDFAISGKTTLVSVYLAKLITVLD
ncbi:MAG: hypothetical protein F4X62_20965 [Caldilineaceae bacterium SB0662_bin_25]|nr:hypothetical protein [Caldilineaceae bacterium SB0662_bin_25]